MKMTPENNVKRIIKVMFSRYPVFWYPAVAGPYCVSGIPDFVGCISGHFFGVEAKAPGKKPTELQLKRKNEIEKAGGKWFLVDGAESLVAVENWFKEVV